MAPGLWQRIRLVYVLVGIVLAALAVRLIQLQVGRHPVLAARAAALDRTLESFPAPGGRVVDRTGRLLVFDRLVFDLHCYLRGELPAKPGGAAGLQADLERAIAPDRRLDGAQSRHLRARLEAEEARLRAGRGDPSCRPRDLILFSDITAAAALEALLDQDFRRRWLQATLDLVPSYRRTYLLGPDGGPALGGVFATSGGPARQGLERLGREGGPLCPGPPERHALGRAGILGRYLLGPAPEAPAPAVLFTTLDRNLQVRLSRILAAEAERVKPRWAAALLMDPRSGDLLAMASWPGFDPNAPADLARSPVAGRRNHCVESRFEPGSTMKSLIVAAALEEGLVRPDEIIDCSWNDREGWRIPLEDGRGSVRVIRDDHRLEPARVPLAQVIVQSSNIGAVKVGRRFRPESYVAWLRRFGLDRRSGLGLPAEVPPAFDQAASLPGNVKSFLRSDGPSISHGYALGMNLVALARAYCALVNGGRLVEPRLLLGVADPEERPLPAPGAAAVLAPGTSDLIRSFLRGVVAEEKGTAHQMAGEEGRKVMGGKTGTARRTGTRHYWALFVGFAPAEAPPRYLAAAVFYKEETHRFYGGTNAGPTVREILLAALAAEAER